MQSSECFIKFWSLTTTFLIVIVINKVCLLWKISPYDGGFTVMQILFIPSTSIYLRFWDKWLNELNDECSYMLVWKYVKLLIIKSWSYTLVWGEKWREIVEFARTIFVSCTIFVCKTERGHVNAFYRWQCLHICEPRIHHKTRKKRILNNCAHTLETNGH
jgi:hypothetical protein